MNKDPSAREPRGPAIAIWTVAGLALGLAFGVVAGNALLTLATGALLGVLFGVFTTRPKARPLDD